VVPRENDRGAAASSVDATGPAISFVDATNAAGVDFVHFNGMSGRFYQPEIMAPGAALFDYDNDGDLDLYLVQGRMLGDGTPLIASPAGRLDGALFRNDLTLAPDGTRRLLFTNVTASSGIATRGYGMGVATGDYDNDGRIDLYVTGFGGNQLFRNLGDGTFADVSVASGVDAPELWGVPATFFDYDRDGWLDLFLGTYLNYNLKAHVPCFGTSGAPDYCRPSVYRPLPNRLYHNSRDGRFTDVTIRSGMGRPFGPALGATAADFNGDGWPDLFVANDEQENQLWINRQDGTFVDTALLAGAALGANGERKANMGVDAADFDADGDEDLIVTELINQGSSLYVNDGQGSFEEQSARLGVRQPTLPYTGFGVAWIDVDNDGWLDLLAVNGDVNQNVRDLKANTNPFPLGQRNLLLRNQGGTFKDATAGAGAPFVLAEASRGAAFGDVDNDGDTDVVIANGAGPARLLLNQTGSSRHWIGLRLVGMAAASGAPSPVTPRDMVGARVGVLRPGRPTLWRRARADGSYASANDPRVLVGLGDAATISGVEVTWPDGRREAWGEVAIDRYTTLTQGTGR
jgi:hypothetical protein